MNLTPYERLMLSLQLRQLAKENPEIDSYARQAEIIEHGYTALYSEVFGSTAEPELSSEVQEEVFEILNMFRALHPGHAAGDDWDPEGDFYYQKFRGFDGNAGSGHYGFARFFIEDMGRFRESAGEYNSHSETLSTYREMLRRWHGLGRKFELSEEEIRAVLDL